MTVDLVLQSFCYFERGANMYFLVNGEKERLDGDINLSIMSVSDSKELLSACLEEIVLEVIKHLPDGCYHEAKADYDRAKRNGAGQFQVENGVYYTVSFDTMGLLTYYSTGCSGTDEYAGECYEIMEKSTGNVIDDFSNAYRFLSNDYGAPATYKGITYHSAEMAFQTAIKKYDGDVPEMMFDILKSKFSNFEMKKRLLLTEDKLLINRNRHHDNYWGNCICAKCKDIEGKNMLGKMLMKIRNDIK